MVGLQGHTTSELRLAVHQEQTRLIRERNELCGRMRVLNERLVLMAKRLSGIDGRLDELGKADDLLDGMS